MGWHFYHWGFCSTIKIHPSKSESNVINSPPHRNEPLLIVEKEFVSFWLKPIVLFLFD